jgi:hypothetical protein
MARSSPLAAARYRSTQPNIHHVSPAPDSVRSPRTDAWAKAMRAMPSSPRWSLPQATRSLPYRPATATAWWSSDRGLCAHSLYKEKRKGKFIFMSIHFLNIVGCSSCGREQVARTKRPRGLSRQFDLIQPTHISPKKRRENRIIEDGRRYQSVPRAQPEGERRG